MLDLLAKLGDTQRTLDLQGDTVHPAQFLGLELNPRAAVLAELCLWIGYLQWHLRTRGKAAIAEPVISKFHTIENRDAVLACDRVEFKRDAAGKPVTQWDGVTFKKHPVTGEAIPDETARRTVRAYVNPRPAAWPAADFIVGNPPFIGAARMRDALGDGYAETLRRLYPAVPESADFVMYWWHKAARLVREGQVQRFGFITTNSLRQTFNRRVLEAHLDGDAADASGRDDKVYDKVYEKDFDKARDKAEQPLSLSFAIPDHPWVENTDGAAVRIAMTVAGLQRRDAAATLQTVTAETEGAEGAIDVTLSSRTGTINADLTIGADVAGAGALKANESISCPGVKLHGAGFIVTREEAAALGLGRIPGLEKHIREYRNGKDLASRPRDVLVIDLFGLSEADVRDHFPEVYQRVYERVKPERDAKAKTKDGKGYAQYWWWFGKPRQTLRSSLEGLSRYIATVETSKHRFFQFLDASVLPDNKLICIAHDDAYVLGVLTSRIHVAWALAAGSHLGVGNDPVYVKSRCFETFPFPEATEAQQARIRDLAERLDAHRKRQLALHGALTVTEMYNVLEALRAGATLTAKQRAIHDQGLVTVLGQLHDELDAAVAGAYGWEGEGENAQRSTFNAQRSSLTDEEVLVRLVALNRARADEEARGVVRYLRPAYQQPQGVSAAVGRAAEQADLGLPHPEPRTLNPESSPLPWPETLAEQIALVRGVIQQTAWQPADGAKSLARHFSGVRAPTLQRLIDALAALGQVG